MAATITAKPGIAPMNGISHVKGSTERPLIHATIPGFLSEVVKRHGDRTAAVFRQSGDRWLLADGTPSMIAIGNGQLGTSGQVSGLKGAVRDIAVLPAI